MPSTTPPSSAKKTNSALEALRTFSSTTGIPTDKLYAQLLTKKIHPTVHATMRQLAAILVQVNDGIPVLDRALQSLPLSTGGERFLSSCNAMMRTVAENPTAAHAVLASMKAFPQEIQSDIQAILGQSAEPVQPTIPDTQTYFVGIGNPTSPAQPVPQGVLPSRQGPPSRRVSPKKIP